MGGVERERGDEGACVRAVFFLIFLFSFFLTFGCAWTARLTPWRESESEREKAREPVKGQNIKQKHHPLSPPLLTSPLSIFFSLNLCLCTPTYVPPLYYLLLSTQFCPLLHFYMVCAFFFAVSGASAHSLTSLHPPFQERGKR